MDFDLLVVSILERGKEIGNKNEVELNLSVCSTNMSCWL